VTGEQNDSVTGQMLHSDYFCSAAISKYRTSALELSHLKDFALSIIMTSIYPNRPNGVGKTGFVWPGPDETHDLRRQWDGREPMARS